MNWWPYILFSLASIFLLPFIEWIRWKAEYGKKPNLDKSLTVAIAVTVWLLLVVFTGLGDWPLQWKDLRLIAFAFACIGIRGVFYDPSLNLFLGNFIDEERTSSNSKTDAAERKHKISFWWQRAMYLGVAIAAGIFYELLKRT